MVLWATVMTKIPSCSIWCTPPLPILFRDRFRKGYDVIMCKSSISCFFLGTKLPRAVKVPFLIALVVVIDAFSGHSPGHSPYVASLALVGTLGGRAYTTRLLFPVMIGVPRSLS